MFAKIGYYGLCFLCLVPSLQASFPFELYSPSSTGATASLSEQAKNYGWMYAGLLYPHFLNINQTGGDQREAESRMFAMASSDKSYCILKNIFGLMPGLFSFEPEDVHKSDVDLGKYPSCGGGIMAGVFNHNGSSKITYPSQFTASSGLMASLVQVFNTGIIMLLFIVITYQIFMGGVLLTAIEGNIMDRNFTLYHMFRMVSGLGLVAPYFAYGYSLLQMIVMYLILLGVSFADSVFVQVVEKYEVNGLLTPKSSVSQPSSETLTVGTVTKAHRNQIAAGLLQPFFASTDPRDLIGTNLSATIGLPLPASIQLVIDAIDGIWPNSPVKTSYPINFSQPVSAQNLSTSLLMIAEAVMGFSFYEKPITGADSADGVASGAGYNYNNRPGISTQCKQAYKKYCNTPDFTECYNQLAQTSRFFPAVLSDPKNNCIQQGHGFLGLMAGRQQDNPFTFSQYAYNPFRDFVRIGVTMMNAGAFYLAENTKDMIGQVMIYNYASLGTKAFLDLIQNYLINKTQEGEGNYRRYVMGAQLVDAISGVITGALSLAKTVQTYYSDIGFGFAILFFPIGLLMSIMIPLYPILIFTFGVIAWLISVLEVMVAAPLIALGIAHPEGHDLMGKASNAVLLLLAAVLRPFMMVAGVLFSVLLIHIAFTFLNIGFTEQLYFMFRNLGYAGMISGPSSEPSLVMIILMGVMMVYMYAGWEIISRVCMLTIQLGSNVLSYFGGTPQDTGAETAMSKMREIKSSTKSFADSMPRPLGAIGSSVIGTADRVTERANVLSAVPNAIRQYTRKKQIIKDNKGKDPSEVDAESRGKAGSPDGPFASGTPEERLNKAEDERRTEVERYNKYANAMPKALFNSVSPWVERRLPLTHRAASSVGKGVQQMAAAADRGIAKGGKALETGIVGAGVGIGLGAVSGLTGLANAFDKLFRSYRRYNAAVGAMDNVLDQGASRLPDGIKRVGTASNFVARSAASVVGRGIRSVGRGISSVGRRFRNLFTR